jgi:hypothetical protein
MIGDEIRLNDKTVEVWNDFLKLESHHPDEQTEFRHALHQLQSIIACRIARTLTAEENIYRSPPPPPPAPSPDYQV